ncbi:isoprenylcysteine carboxylmethyltransferase family protein [Sphaerisporangium sp. B11E5]|uniref:methyltransferase family protein n=1 Tax=Sphaerisporangium sp. B11E5 TaxID=3153563 RepID=UPI00325CCC0C
MSAPTGRSPGRPASPAAGPGAVTASRGSVLSAAARRRAAHIAPVLFWVAVAVTVAGFAARLGDGGPMGVFAAAFVAANLGWLLLETPVTFRRPSAPPREVATLVTYALTRVATMSAAILVPPPWAPSPWLAVPVLLFISGVLLRVVAMRELGRFYSHLVIRRDDHLIVRTGPYRSVRHPAYAGMLLGHAGLVLFFLNPASAALLAALAAVIGWRIRVEERELMAVPAYRAYAAGRPRLVPGLW